MRAMGRRARGERLERMQASPRWNGGGFRNLLPIAEGLRAGEMPSLSEFLCGGARRAPKAPLPSIDPREAWARPPEDGLRATWLGHSTVLVELDGARILTDPVWGERASPMGFAGPKRFQPVPITLEAIGPIDAVLVSHDHYDHLDHPTVLELARLGHPIITSLGVGAHLEAWGVPAARITELDWWEQATVGPVTVTATPSQHFSGRGLSDRNRTLWSSFSLHGPRHSVFFSGDTGLSSEYTLIQARQGRFDLVMLEVGAYHPSWGDMHLGPHHALEALALLGGGALLPIHWGTFNLALHDWDDPVETLLREAPARGVDLRLPRIGGAVEPAREQTPVPWWRVVDAAPEPIEAAPIAELPAPPVWPLD